MKKITLVFIISLLYFNGVLAQSIANYDIAVTTIWNSTNHTSVPENAHWSALAGATHKNQNDILEFGVTAPLTNGIKDIAETGATANFKAEINTQITAGNANQYLEKGFSPSAGNNSNSTITNVSVSENFPLITLVSMVAPSPDWFIAVNSLNLRSGNNSINNGWKASFTIDVFVYDAGTDNGTNYGSSNVESAPRQPISMVTGFPINGNKMATITFTYNSSTLSNSNFEKLENIKIFPNPTSNFISISKPLNIELNDIEIYSTLGKLKKRKTIDKSISLVNIDVSNLESGIYLMKLNSILEHSKILKFIVK